MTSRRTRGAFTLVELIVVVAIVVVLVGLLLPAVQKVRESAARAKCANNLKQVALAIHGFHDQFGVYPTYNGIAPVGTGGTTQSSNAKAVYGSWVVHVLPFLEQKNLYDTIYADVREYGNTGGAVSIPGGPLITPAQPAVLDTTGLVWRPAIPPTYTQWTAAGGTQQWVSATSGNGYVIWILQFVPPRYPDPGTGTPAGWYIPLPGGGYQGPVSPPVITPAQPAVYGPPGAPQNTYVGVFRPETRRKIVPSLICPSDPSREFDGNSVGGLVYAKTAAPWSATNYLANWNALTTTQAAQGFRAAPGRIARVTDGLSNTVLVGEAYSWCENRGRTAFVGWHEGGNGGTGYGGVHNFGITFGLTNHQIQVGTDPAVTVSNSLGAANPAGNPELLFPFQVRPQPYPVASCPKGADCCDVLTVQSGHAVLQVALGDGSVRGLAPTVSRDTWRGLLLPQDGKAIGGDW